MTAPVISAGDLLTKLLDRPRYLPQPTREEIVGAALAKLHADLTAVRARSSLNQDGGKP
jgi:hypothetical protein